MYPQTDQYFANGQMPQRQTAAAPMYGSGGMTPLPWMGNNRGLFPGSSGGGWQTPSWGGQSGSAQPRGVAFRPNPQPLPWNAGGSGGGAWGGQSWGGQPSPYPTPYSSGAMTGGSISGPTNPSMPGMGVGGAPTGTAGVVGGPQNNNGGFMSGGMPPSQNFANPVGNNTTGNGGLGNLVQGQGQVAHDMGAMNNYGQLDTTGQNMWMNAGGGGQGKWVPYSSSDPNQSAIHNMFQTYGSGWYSGNPTAFGHSTDMAPQFQALYGRQGTPQELQKLYMGVNPGEQQAAHNAFAAQSSSYNPASSSYNPQAVQNLTSLNLLAHQ